jgi:hypothetical protein
MAHGTDAAIPESLFPHRGNERLTVGSTVMCVAGVVSAVSLTERS